MTGKDNLLAFPGRPAIEAEAAAWVARFDAGDVSAKDQAAFQEWLSRSALHRQVIAEFGSLWAEFDALKLPLERPKPGAMPVCAIIKPACRKERSPGLRPVRQR